MAFLGMMIAWAAATAGQDARRARDTLQLNYDRFYWRWEVDEARLAGMPPEVIAQKQKILDAQLAAGIPSYAKFGRQFTSWDGYRYEEIIDQGYLYHQPSDSLEVKDSSIMYVGSEKRIKNVVWYPLYPLLGWMVKSILHVSANLALTIVSWTCCLLGALVLFAYVRRYFMRRADGLAGAAGESAISGADAAARWAVALLLVGPCAIFLYANFTESLFVLLLTLFLFCLQERWWWRAALVAAVASACRSQGVLFGPILAVTFLLRQWPRGPMQWLGRLGMAAAMGMLSGVGLLLYMIYLNGAFHDPLAFMHAQKYWNVGIGIDHVLFAANPWHAWQHIKHTLQNGPVDWPRLWEGLCLIWPPVVLLIWGWRYLSFELQLVAWILWGLPYVSNSMAGNPPFDTQWMSMGRFMSVALPIYIIGGAIFARRPWAGAFFLIPWAATFGVFAYLYGSGAWIG